MKYIKLTDKGEEKMKLLPFGLRYIAKYLMESIDSIFNGDCSEEQIESAVGTLKQNADGKISKDDVLNYDKAGEILGFGATNRNALKALLDKHGIKQQKINNMSCGFLRSEVIALRDKLNKKR